MNVSNGGLIATLNGCLYAADLENFAGTHIIDGSGQRVGGLQGIMWFAAPDDRGFYFSNQRDCDYLTYFDGGRGSETRMEERPCANLIMSSDELYLLDEENGYICAFDVRRQRSSPVVKERVSSFVLEAGMLYYASEGFLKQCDLRGRHAENLLQCEPVCLNVSQGKLIFADEAQNSVLTVWDIRQKTAAQVGHLRTQSMAADGDYVFVADMTDNGSIVRVRLSTGETLRFCGEKTDRLHIEAPFLYFLNSNDSNAWYRIPLSGGRHVRLIERAQ